MEFRLPEGKQPPAPEDAVMPLPFKPGAISPEDVRSGAFEQKLAFGLKGDAAASGIPARRPTFGDGSLLRLADGGTIMTDTAAERMLDIRSRSSGGGLGTVHVQSYEQNRDGHDVRVSEHYRGRPGDQSEAHHSAKSDALPTLEESFLIDEWRDERRSSPPPNLTPDQQRTWKTLDTLRNLGRNRFGHKIAPSLIDHYLDGSGEPWEVDADWARKYGPIQEGEARSQRHFEEWLTGSGKAREDNTFGTIDDWLASGKSSLKINGMHWDGLGKNRSFNPFSDQELSLGSGSVTATGDLYLERHGNEVVITGIVEQQVHDKYDFNKGTLDSETLGLDGRLPHGLPAGDFTLDRARIEDMEKAGGAKAFKLTSSPWRKKLTGRLKLDNTGKVVGSEFHWEEVPQ